MKEIRCPLCRQLLLKAITVIGEIKCSRCKNIIKLNEDTNNKDNK